MLTGYIFAGSDVAVERLLLIRERPAPIPEAPIEHLRRKEAKLNGDRISHWAKGPPITVNVGSFLRILESFAFAGLL
jgi:hypothetical protein